MLILLGVIISINLSAADAYFIAAHEAQCYVKPSNKSQPAYKLKMGTPVSTLKKSGIWRQVSHNSQKGWIHKMFLSSKNPNEERKGFVSVFNNFITKLKSKSNSTRKRAVVMGIRGLDEEGDVNNSDIEPDLDTVDLIDSNYRQLPRTQIRKFLNTIR